MCCLSLKLEKRLYRIRVIVLRAIVVCRYVASTACDSKDVNADFGHRSASVYDRDSAGSDNDRATHTSN